MKRLELRTVDQVADVAPALWDELAGADDLQGRHAFVLLCERSAIEGVTRFRHFLLYQGERLVARASAFVMEVPLETLAPPWLRRMVAVVRRARPRFLRLPVAFCGLPVSLGGSALRLRPDAPGAAVLGALAGALDDLARACGAGLLCVKELDGAERRTCAPLEALGYVAVPSLPTWSLPVAWASVEDYVAAMRAPYRRQLLAARRRAERAGLTIERMRAPGALVPAFFPLYQQIMDRAEYLLERLPERFFAELAQTFDAAVEAVVVREGERPVAAALNVETDTALHFLLAGLDYRRHRQTGAYQALVAEVVASGIHAGRRTIVLGQTSAFLKGRLGAEAEPRYLLLRHRRRWLHRLLRMAAPLLFPAHRPPALRVFAGARGGPRRAAAPSPRPAFPARSGDIRPDAPA